MASPSGSVNKNQELKELMGPPRHPPSLGAYLRLHPGRLEHKKLNGYKMGGKKIRGVTPSTC